MKKTILLSIMLATASFAYSIQSTTGADMAKSKNDAAMCKMFSGKAINYQKNMRDDSYAKKTLESYKTRAELYCNSN